MTCYMCDKPATGNEHIPPKCLFPEQKDLPAGVDYRKDLFTVPSCDEHNSKKSKEDEYFLYVLTMMRVINSVGRHLYNTKVRRAIKRNSSLLKKHAATAQRVAVNSDNGAPEIGCFAIHLEEDRFDQIIDRIARAIYYFHYQKKWLRQIQYLAEFLYPTIKNGVIDTSRHKISNEADILFSGAIFYGSNPDVFKYQVAKEDNSTKMRLYFYGNCKLLLIYDN